ncbi:MAG TPA: hypothetical protein VFM99_08635 [Chitinophagales bacterium]|nr:hypothetical protein [Chitinophagales bacterium]
MQLLNSCLKGIFFLFIIICSPVGCKAQSSMDLKPGYDKDELLAIMPAMERTYDSEDIGGFKTPSPKNMKQVFRSRISPLMNRFDVWLTNDKKAVITIRGTIIDSEAMSSAAVLYSLMAPANGRIKVSDSSWFEYKLAELPDAGVHLGMLLGLYFMSDELVDQLHIQYQSGVKDFIIMGHSQGSGNSLLVTSYLWYLRKDGKLPADMRFKTYSIATPKTGNLQYVYDYEKLTAGGYALSLNNVIDWVPSVPMTFQSKQDFPEVSPFRNLKGFLLEANYSPGPNFDKRFEEFSKFIPEVVTQITQIIHENIFPKIAGAMPGYIEPECLQSFNYERSGLSVPLVPDEEYYKLFPNDPEKFNIWENHSVYPYYILIKSN